ncbi:YihY/virulence factor BrkB family protein [Agromyces soli]
MARRPRTPRQLAPDAWQYAVRRASRAFFTEHRYDDAAALTFYGVVAIFPAVLVVVSVFALAGERGRVMRATLDLAADVVPSEVLGAIRDRLLEYADSSVAGWGFVTGIALALWSASAYVTAFGRTMNEVYGIAEGRPFWKLRAAQLLLTAAILALVVVIVALLLASGAVARGVAAALGLGSELQMFWAVVRWPLLLAATLCVVDLLYGFTPNVRRQGFRWLSVGAAIAIAVVVVVSAGFALYVDRFADYDRVYGSLAGVVVFLLWLWFANCGLVFGAELDAELLRARQLQSGAPADERILVPPRDTTRSAVRARRRAEDVERARRLRGHGRR